MLPVTLMQMQKHMVPGMQCVCFCNNRPSYSIDAQFLITVCNKIMYDKVYKLLYVAKYWRGKILANLVNHS